MKKIYVDIDFFEGQGYQNKRFPILNWIIENEGRKAPLREIGKEIGIGESPQKVKHYIMQMMDNGMIYRDGGKGYYLTPIFKEKIKLI